MIPTKEDLERASTRIAPFIHKTPVLTSQSLDRISGARLFFKCENFQKMGAFKMRGASNAVLCLSAKEKEQGVATHSSGNFAQALALAAKSGGIKAYIVMPSNAPKVKKEAVLGYGAEVIDCEPNMPSREAVLEQVVQKTGATFIHPSNDMEVILGQGTAALELIREVPNLDFILTPVGGGGLLAGTALAAHYFSPGTHVFAGEPMGADDAWQSLRAGKIIPVSNPQTIADGLRTSLGDQNFPIIKKWVRGIIRVEESEILDALRLIWERMKIIVEPSSAVALAAVLKEREVFGESHVGIILSGGNVDLGALSSYFSG